MGISLFDESEGKKAVFRNIYLFLIIIFSFVSFFATQPFSPLVRAAIYGVFVFYSGLFFLLNIRRHRMALTWVAISGIVYYILSTISYIHNGDIMTEGFPHFQYVFLGLICLSDRSSEDIVKEISTLVKMVTVFSIIMVVVSLLTVPLVLYCPSFVESLPKELNRMVITSASIGNGRFCGFTNNPNMTANFCTVGFMLSYYLLFVKTGWKWKTAAVADCVLSFYLITFKCASRTAMLTIMAFACIFPFLYFIAFHWRNMEYRKWFYIVLVLIIVAILLGISIVVFVEPLRDYVLNNIIRISSLQTGSGRTNIWRFMLEASKGHRIFGVSKQVIRENFNVGSMHNIFLELFIIMGVPTMIAYLVYFFFSICQSWKMAFSQKIDSHYLKMLYLLILSTLLVTILQGMSENFLFSKYCLTGMFVTYFLATTQVLWKNKIGCNEDIK